MHSNYTDVAGSFAYAEFAEDNIEHVLDVNATGDPTDRMCCVAQILGG